MSELTYVNYKAQDLGQGGWDDSGEVKANDAKGQVDLAFENVDKALRAVGLRGWEDVFSVRSYHRDIDTTFPIVVEKFKERIPGHRPTWTCVQVARLAFPAMDIEIEVEAYRGKK
ncbi:Endoribonuclease L-PSP [Rhizoctonia solani]|uniref:Endoribonuclease L-PSP n=1 Tax=Rhizoctonia solani TaxID=456999 RepID=A0A8H7IDC6_9AGAM|nr:Endoribonuclease L-PSP [Rhizoctonia solani]